MGSPLQTNGPTQRKADSCDPKQERAMLAGGRHRGVCSRKMLLCKPSFWHHFLESTGKGRPLGDVLSMPKVADLVPIISSLKVLQSKAKLNEDLHQRLGRTTANRVDNTGRYGSVVQFSRKPFIS